ncbi:hypothetical protein N2152v2_004081 [Parachlorella kessleri]
MAFPQHGGRFGGFSGPGMFGPGAGGRFEGMARPAMVAPAAGGFPGPMPGMQGPVMQMGAMPMMAPGPGPSGPMMGMAHPGGPLARPGMAGMQPGMQGVPGMMAQQLQPGGPMGAPFMQGGHPIPGSGQGVFPPQQQQQQQPQQPVRQPHFQDIGARRRESHAALLRRQVAGVKLSPSLAGSAVFDQCAALKAKAPPQAEGRTSTAAKDRSWEAIGGAQRCYMGEVLSSKQEVLLVPSQPPGYVARAAMQACMQLYSQQGLGQRQEEGQLMASKYGSFLVPTDFVAVLGEEQTQV